MTRLYVLIGLAGALLGVYWAWSRDFITIGKSLCEARDVAALQAEVQRQQEWIERYKVQFQEAEDAKQKANEELELYRRQPVSRVVCHSVQSGAASVPKDSGAASGGTAVGGELPAVVEFDPTDALYAEADRADELVEACRDVLRRWPRN